MQPDVCIGVPHLNRRFLRHLFQFVPKVSRDEWNHEASVAVFDGGFDQACAGTSVLRIRSKPLPFAKEAESGGNKEDRGNETLP